MRAPPLSTGMASLDGIIEKVMPGDNIVWLVSSPEQYDYFASRYLDRCVRDGRQTVYVHFDVRLNYADLVPGGSVDVLDLDPAEGPGACADVLREQIRSHDGDIHYLFDNLSLLCSAWGDEDAFVEFFRAVCPLLFEMEAVAYFALLRGGQSNATVAKIRDTTQVLLEVYERDGMVVLQPVKVWDRYSERMFHPHVLFGGQFIPLESLRSPGSAGPSEVDLLTGYQTRAGTDASLSIREELIRSTVSDRPEYIRIARNYFTVGDVVEVKRRTVGGGTIGGKAAGMLLSNRILKAVCRAEGRDDWLSQLREPESFFLGSDVYFSFLINNNLMHWPDLKYREPDQMREAFPRLRQEFRAGEFPRAIRERLRGVVRAFRGQPIIVRSSSLLEDSLDMAFAGKYESIFLGNQGAPRECLAQLLDAVKQVYASSLGPDALVYRLRRGLLEFQERMAVLIQKVEGTRYGGLFFPPVAGVAFSRNPYPWSERIDRNAGLVRLVVGLGTRAVDRVEDDYPRLVALSHPGLHPDGDYMSSPRYHQKVFDAIDLASNRLKGLPIRGRVGADYTEGFYIFSLYSDGFLRAPVSRRMSGRDECLVVTFQNLLARSDFVELMRFVLDRVERSCRYPVDIEFTLSVGDGGRVTLCLLQCRPLTQRTEFRPAELPSGLPPEKVLFTARRAVSNGELHNVRYIALIDPRDYDAVADAAGRTRLARAVGAVNQHPRVMEGQFVLIGPGRWGSVNIELGVPVAYADISNARLLIEMARPRDGYTPEVSYGTHFFQDLVESGILYLPLYPEDPTCEYREEFFATARNCLPDLLPDWADVAGALRLIDVPASADGLYLHVAMNQEESLGIGYLGPPVDE